MGFDAYFTRICQVRISRPWPSTAPGWPVDVPTRGGATRRPRSIPSITDTGVKVILQSKSDVERRVLLARASRRVTTSAIDHPSSE